MILPSQVIAAGTIKDSQMISLDTLTAGTETIIPVYAFIPKGSVPNGVISTAQGGCVRFEWTIHGNCTIVDGLAGATLTFKLYWGTVPGTGTAAYPSGFVTTFDLDNAQGFIIKISSQTTNESDGTTDRLKMPTEFFTLVTPSAGGTPVLTSKMYYGSAPYVTCSADLYMWLTVTGSTTGSSAVTYFDPRTVMCVAHGLQPISLEQ